MRRFEAWWQREIASRIRLSGYRDIGIHFESVTGDTDAFEQTNYGGQGGQRITDQGFIRAQGSKVLGLFDFDVNLQDSRFQDPQSEKFTVNFDRGPWSISAGDIQGRLLNTNQFARFTKTLRGVSAGYKSGPFQIKALRSQARGEARTISLQGNNTPGPYYLQSSQVVRGSESITVDGVLMQYGQDYWIDYDLGSVTFENRITGASRLIPPSSTIVATYESFGFGGPAGTVEGVGATYSFGQSGTLGLSAMRQLTGSSGSLSTRLEKFQGYGAPGIPYTLQFTPLPGQPVSVRIDGVLQVEGIDYYFDPVNKAVFYTTRFVPSTSEVDVVYTPTPTTNVTGDREVFGIDYRLPLGKGGKAGELALSQAIGRLTNTATPQSGSARGLSGRYAIGKFTFTGSMRDVGDDFVSIESTGFNRNEKSHDLGLEYKPTPTSIFNLATTNSSIAVRSVNGGTANITRTRFTRNEFNHTQTVDPSKGWPLTFSLVETSGESASGQSKVDTASLSTRRQFGNLDSRFGFDSSRISGSSSGQVDSFSLRNTYNAGRNLIAGLDLSLSNVRSNGESGTGRSIGFRARYFPSQNLSATLSYTDSDNGGVSSLANFTGGYGYGYGGNGFSNGADPTILGASSGRRLAVSLDMRPSDRLSLSGVASIYRSSGSVSSNSETRQIGGLATFDIGMGNRLEADVNVSRTQFIDTAQSSSSNTLGIYLDGSPPGRFRYRVGLNKLFTGGGGQFGQDNSDIEVSLGYRLADRHFLSFDWNRSHTTGYYPQDDKDTSLTYRYQIWRSLALNVAYRFHDVVNLDSNNSSGGYQSQGLHFELAFNFGQ